MMEQIIAGEGDQQFLLLVTNDLNVRIMRLENDELIVISQMPLESLDHMVFSFFKQRKPNSLFCFD